MKKTGVTFLLISISIIGFPSSAESAENTPTIPIEWNLGFNQLDFEITGSH